MPSHLLREFLENNYVGKRLNLQEDSADQIRYSLNLFEKWLGRPAQAKDLSKRTVVDWMRWLAQSRAPSTVNSKRGAIVSLWNAMAECGLCPPPYRIPKLRQPARIPVAWTLEEVNKIFQQCAQLPGVWDGVPISLCWIMGILVLWDTAGRVSLLLKAKLEHVLLEHGKLLVPAENLKGRRADKLFTLHQQTLAVIRLTLPYPRERLFPFPHRKKRIWAHLKRILRMAGLPDDRKHMFHCFRRSSESYAARERGVQWAAAAVGHSVDVALRSYISPLIAPTQPALVQALPRPELPPYPQLRIVS